MCCAASPSQALAWMEERHQQGHKELCRIPIPQPGTCLDEHELVIPQ